MALVFAPPTPEGEAPGFFAALPGHVWVRGVNRGLLASLKGDPYQGGRRIERILRDSPRHAYAREVRATIRRLFERSR